jgi:hypothetical protein
MTPPPNDASIRIRVPAATVTRWRAAADADGRTLSAWIRRTLDLATAPPPKKGSRR